jgi:hypothetical protein
MFLKKNSFMKILLKIIATIGAFNICLVLIAASIIMKELQPHKVAVLNYTPVLPYAEYDYMTTEDSAYLVDGKQKIIPAFFRTDFASIPKALWFLDAPFKASFVYSAIWHDYHYSCPDKMSRKEIDDIFYSLLIDQNATTWEATKMYIGVRVFGKTHFVENGLCDEIILEDIQEDRDLFQKGVK